MEKEIIIMQWGREGIDAIEQAVFLYKMRLIKEVENKYKDSFRLIMKEDVDEIVATKLTRGG